LLACVVGACSSYDASHAFDFPDERALQSLAEWEQQHLPAGNCAAEVPDLVMKVVPASEIETDAYCGSENLGTNVLGCFFYDGSVPTVVLRNQMPIKPEQAIEHELRHWLAMCSGYDPTGDAGHGNKPIWYPTNLQDDWDYGAAR
jgi:hypothetical protein